MIKVDLFPYFLRHKKWRKIRKIRKRGRKRGRKKVRKKERKKDK